jgi:hypothetical protein
MNKVKTLPKPVKEKKVTKKQIESEKKKLDKECRVLWSKCVIERDRTCKWSNEDTGLSAHHIRSVSHWATRYLLENGLTLSWRKVHFLQKANPERFQDIVIEIIGQEKYDELKRKSLMPVHFTLEDLKEQKEFLEKQLLMQEFS